MFAQHKQGAQCVAEYKGIQVGAIVPKVNENWALVEESVAASGWQEPLIDVEGARSAQKQKVRADYDAACLEPVTDSSGKTWNGGFDSAIKLDAAHRLAEKAGKQSVVFYDFDNKGYSLPLQDAQMVVLEVSADFELNLARKQALFDQINAAQTLAEIESVVWNESV